MAVQVEYRYGTTAEHASYVGGTNEITVDTTKKTLVVHDGAKTGGYPLAKEDLSNVPSMIGATSTVPGVTGKIPAPAAGDQGKVLYGNGAWGNLPEMPVLRIRTYAGTATTLSLADTDNYIRLTSEDVKTLTVPNESDVNFPIGTTISGMSVGTGQLTILKASQVKVNSPETMSLRDKPKVSFVLTKVASDEWDLSGDLQPE